MARSNTLPVLVGIMALAACGAADERVETDAKSDAPVPTVPSGKADDAGIPVRGTLGFGDIGALEDNTIPQPLQFDAYELDIAAGGIATIEVSQKGTSRGFDSLLYIFGPRAEDGSYPAKPLAYDDDAGWGLLSRVRDWKAEQGGTYLVAVGSFEGKGLYRLEAECLNGACEPPPTTGECVFGTSYGDLVSGRAPAVTITHQERVASASPLSTLQREQLVASLQYAGFEDVETAEDAIRTVDAGEVNLTSVWDVSNEGGYDVFEYGLGDTSVGTVYASGTTERAAVISDLDFYDCVAFEGAARQDCASSADCAGDDLQCEGIVNGVGSCIDAGVRPPGTDAECATTLDCAEGLVCAGENFGGGLCNPAWMRRRFYVEPFAAIDGSGMSVTIDSYGLATVHTDVTLDLLLTHDDLSKVRVVLVNPTGTESVLHDRDGALRELSLRGAAIAGFPGDEDANGTWTLRVENLDPTLGGRLYDIGLEVTSRWD